jgi:hypothetical protein
MTSAEARHYLEVLQFELDENNMIKLNSFNSSLIERKINQDRRYRVDKAYVLYRSYGVRLPELSYQRLKALIWEIKKVNRIQGVEKAWASIIANFVFAFPRGGLAGFCIELLAYTPSLVNEMVNYMSRHGATRKISWCSKICKYFEMWEGLNRDSNYQNQYAIYDRVLSVTLPYYLHKYNIPYWGGTQWNSRSMELNKVIEHYSQYDDTVSQLQQQICDQNHDFLSKHQIDHILWYYYRDFDKKDLSSIINVLIIC